MVHRDLKLENILLSTSCINDAPFNIKVKGKEREREREREKSKRA